MTRHIFLTGKKRIGKSTLLKKNLERFAGDAGGFFTIRTDAFLKSSYSVHMFGLHEAAIPNEDNLLFICGKADGHISENFDRLGCKILSQCASSSLMVMDELGPHEANAELFRKAVLRFLDGNVPILGVLQASAESFWTDLVRHPHVQVIEINESNREDHIIMELLLSTAASPHL